MSIHIITIKIIDALILFHELFFLNLSAVFGSLPRDQLKCSEFKEGVRKEVVSALCPYAKSDWPV